MNPELMFHTEDEVMFYDTDCGGVVHNLAYLRMIEACRTKLGAKLGMDYKTMSDLQQFAVVVRHEIDYVPWTGPVSGAILKCGALPIMIFWSGLISSWP